MIKIAILMYFSSLNLFANTFSGKSSNLNFSLPSEYKLYRDFLGLPYVFIKQDKASKNTSISLTPTGIKTQSLEMKILEKNYKQYQDGRISWAKKNNLNINKFIPFTSFENTTKSKITVAGFEYTNSVKLKNIEKSYFIICPNETFHVKLLTESQAESTKKIETLETALKNSQCL